MGQDKLIWIWKEEELVKNLSLLLLMLLLSWMFVLHYFVIDCRGDNVFVFELETGPRVVRRGVSRVVACAGGCCRCPVDVDESPVAIDMDGVPMALHSLPVNSVADRIC